ncbi:MAG: AI-2E family transporter [Minisyncoccia bacterium]
MDKNVTISISLGTVFSIFLVGAGFWALYELTDLVLVVITAIVIASATEPGTKALMRQGIPRVFSVVIVYLGFISFIVGLAYFFLPALLQDTSAMLSNIAHTAETGNMATFKAPFIGDVSMSELSLRMNDLFQKASGDPIGTTSAIFGGIVQFFLVIVFSFYFSMQEKGIEQFLRIATPIRYEEYIVDLWNRTRHKIGLWMQGQLILGVIVGILSYLGLMLLGIPHPLLLAVIAGFFEIIPLFGPTLSAVPAAVLAYTAGGVSLALGVVVFYFIIQQFENHLIYPLVVTKVVGVPPVMIILSLAVGIKIAGFMGVLLAVPTAALIQEILNDWDKIRHIPPMPPDTDLEKPIKLA